MAFFKALATVLGMIERKQERDTGAALQQGVDANAELDRITAAVGAKPIGLSDDDEANRDNVPTGPARLFGVDGGNILSKSGHARNRRRKPRVER